VLLTTAGTAVIAQDRFKFEEPYDYHMLHESCYDSCPIRTADLAWQPWHNAYKCTVKCPFEGDEPHFQSHFLLAGSCTCLLAASAPGGVVDEVTSANGLCFCVTGCELHTDVCMSQNQGDAT